MSYEEVARTRHHINRYSETNEPIDEHADDIGVDGEVAFAREILGIENYQPTSGKRTPGYQFHWQAWTIKVQTSKTPGHLLVKERTKRWARIYVLAGITSKGHVYFCGWLPGDRVREAPVKVMTTRGGYVLPSHAVPRDELWPMADLCRMIGANGAEARRIIERDRAQRADRGRTAGEPDSSDDQARLPGFE